MKFNINWTNANNCT